MAKGPSLVLNTRGSSKFRCQSPWPWWSWESAFSLGSAVAGALPAPAGPQGALGGGCRLAPGGMGQAGPHLGGVQETDQGDLAPMGTAERRPMVMGRPCQGADGAVGPGHFGQSGRVMALVKYCAFQRGHLCRQPPRAWPGPRGHSSSSRLLQAARAVAGEARRGGGRAGVETQVP